jgi:hypothetical protein
VTWLFANKASIEGQQPHLECVRVGLNCDDFAIAHYQLCEQDAGYANIGPRIQERDWCTWAQVGLCQGFQKAEVLTTIDLQEDVVVTRPWPQGHLEWLQIDSVQGGRPEVLHKTLAVSHVHCHGTGVSKLWSGYLPGPASWRMQHSTRAFCPVTSKTRLHDAICVMWPEDECTPNAERVERDFVCHCEVERLCLTSWLFACCSRVLPVLQDRVFGSRHCMKNCALT